MASIFSLHKEIIPPTACDCCAYASFTSPGSKNIIVSCASVLQIYDVVFTRCFTESKWEEIPRLELVYEAKIKGIVTSIGVIRPQTTPEAGPGTDYILLTFKDAKISMLEWSPLTQSTVTVSIHYYEREEFKREEFVDKYTPIVRVETDSACAIMNFYTDKIAIIPFKGDPLAQISNILDSETSKQLFYPSYVIPYATLDKSINNIIDMTFVHSFFGPLLAVLYEPNLKYTGKPSLKKTTNSLIFISMDPAQRSFNVVTKLDDLPHNCYKLVATPPPLSGVVIVTHNALIHVDQTSDYALVCFNRYYHLETNFGLRKNENGSPKEKYTDMSHICRSLEMSEIYLLNPDTLFVVLHTGEVMIVQMVNDLDSGSGWKRKKGGVKSFRVEMSNIFLSVPSCGTQIKMMPCFPNQNSVSSEPGYFFIGSATADSLLIKVEELDIDHNVVLKDSNSVGNDSDYDDIYGSAMEDINDRLRLTDSKSKALDNDTDIKEDAMEICDNSENADITKDNRIEPETPRFKLRICDYLVSHSPIRDASIIECTPYTTHDYIHLKEINQSSEHIPYQIVTCTGMYRSGALSVLQRSVKFAILETLKLPEITNVWYLEDCLFVVSNSENTKIISVNGTTDKDFNERIIKTMGTLDIKYVNGVLIQVHHHGVAVFKDTLKEFLVSSLDDSHLVSSSISFPYILLLLDSGRVILLDVELPDCNISSSILPLSDISNCALYCPDDAWWTKIKSGDQMNESDLGNPHKGSVIWCFSVTNEGYLNILSLPDMQQKSFSPKICLKPAILNDEGETNAKRTSNIVRVTDLLVMSLGRDDGHKAPYLFARLENDDFIVYKAFKCRSNSIRFLRVTHERFCSPPVSVSQEQIYMARKHLVSFEGIGEENSMKYSGVFVSGELPYWVMCAGTGGIGAKACIKGSSTSIEVLSSPPSSGKNQLRFHPNENHGEVLSFSFMNGNKFAILSNGELKICALNMSYNYQTSWPLCRVPLMRTPHKIGYHQEHNLVVVATSAKYIFSLQAAQDLASAMPVSTLKSNGKQENPQNIKIDLQSILMNRPHHTYLPSIDCYQVELICPITWKSIDKIPLETYEYVLALDIVELDSLQSPTGRKQFLAIGTGTLRGEDIATRGRILIYDIIKLSTGKNRTYKFKELNIRSEKGPVTTLCSIDGYLLAATGSKIVVYSFENCETLTGVAFIDKNIYVTSLCAVKNFILVGDILKSISFLCFQEEPYKLVVLGKDYHNLSTYSTEFIFYGGSLGLCTADGDRNFHIMAYSPDHLQSSGGQKLLRRADIHTGRTCSKLLRLRRPWYTIKSDSNTAASLSRFNRSDKIDKSGGPSDIVLIANLEGSISLMIPIAEKIYKRLHGLYSKMSNGINHVARLNPKGFCHVGPRARPATASFLGPAGSSSGSRFILDGDLLFEYLSLGHQEQTNMAKGIGSLSSRIIEDLINVVKGSLFY